MKAIALSSCAVACAVLWHGHQPALLQIANATPSPAGYVTSPVEEKAIVQVVSATGTLNAWNNVEVGSQLSGQIVDLLVDFNDTVEKGQILAKLDKSSFQAQVDAARAALDSAKADERISKAHLSRAMIEVKQAELQRVVLHARVDTATIALKTASRTFDRKTFLNGRGAEAEANVIDSGAYRDSARVALNEADAVFATSATAVDSAKAEVERCAAELEGAQATVARLEAQLRSAEADLERTNIRSPIDGVVIGRNVTRGQTLASGLEAKTIFQLAGDLRRMEIYARVDESDISRIRLGEEATFTVDSYPGREFRASVTQIRKAPQLLQNVVTYTVVLTAENDDYALLPGMTVLAKIVTKRTPTSMSVPLAALRFNLQNPTGWRGGETDTSVWVLKSNGEAKRVALVVGDDDGERVVVKSGDIQASDKVIVARGNEARSRR
jgi:HlyD family secretion protein